jgi:hypothetical protein
LHIRGPMGPIDILGCMTYLGHVHLLCTRSILCFIVWMEQLRLLSCVYLCLLTVMQWQCGVDRGPPPPRGCECYQSLQM